MRSNNKFSFWTVTLVAVVGAFLALSPTLYAVTPAPDGGYAGQNTAEGTNALFSLTSGFADTAIGFQALYHDTSGSYNTAEGTRAAFSNTSGNFNTAMGWQALYNNSTAPSNTAIGTQALFNNSTGSSNIAIGANAGLNIFLSNNIDIGNTGDSTDFNTTRIGAVQQATFIAGISGVSVAGNVVCVDSSGQLGECAVTGASTKSGNNANQLARKVEEQASRIAEQDKAIAALTATVKQQTAQIQKVSAELTVIKTKPQLVNNQK